MIPTGNGSVSTRETAGTLDVSRNELTGDGALDEREVHRRLHVVGPGCVLVLDHLLGFV